MNDATGTTPTDSATTAGRTSRTRPARSRVGPGLLLEGVTVVAALAAVATVGVFARGDLSGEDAAALSSPEYTCPAPALPAAARSGPGTGADPASPSGTGTVSLSGTVSRSGTDDRSRTGTTVGTGARTVSPAVLHPDAGTLAGSDPGVDALARALRVQGRSRFADVYGAVVLERTRGRVALCVTDLDRGRDLALAARAADPRLDLSRVDLFSCRFTEREGRTVLSALRGGRGHGLAFPVYAVGFSADGSGLQVTTTASGAASGRFREGLVDAAGGMPVHLVVRP